MTRFLTALLLLPLLLLPAVGMADDDLPQFPKIAPPDSLPDAACEESLAHSTAWALGVWSAGDSTVQIAANHWQTTGEASGAAGDIVSIDQCIIHLGNADNAKPSFDAIRTETGALYGTMRTGGDAPPHFALFHKKN